MHQSIKQYQFKRLRQILRQINVHQKHSKELDFHLAWVCFAHKVQGLTLHQTVVSLELVKQRTFPNLHNPIIFNILAKINILSDFDPKIIRTNQLDYQQLLLMVQPLRMKLLEMMTSLISLKAWQYFITNKILNVWSRRVLLVYFTSNWLLAYPISVILLC